MADFWKRFWGNVKGEEIPPAPPVDPADAIRKSVTVTGRVQGVGFRYFVQQTARELGVTGWVKNLDDGSVTMEIQGDVERIEEIMRRVRKGNAVGRVDTFDSADLEVVEGENTFAIRY